MELEAVARCPQIIEYENYRDYLYDMYNYRKASRPGFSYRRFSQMVGLKSPNYLQRVIQGDRNLTDETGERVARVLGLSTRECDYFLALVKLDNAANIKDRVEAEANRRIIAKRILCKDIPESQKQIFSKWYHLLVRELVLLKDFEPSGVYMSQKLGGLLTPEACQNSFEILVQSGFILYKDGRYMVSDPALTTGTQQFAHAQLQSIHGQALRFWGKNIEKLGRDEQELHMLNIPISAAKIPELRRRIECFQEELIGWLQDETEADEIVQLGTYLFPYKAEE